MDHYRVGPLKDFFKPTKITYLAQKTLQRIKKFHKIWEKVCFGFPFVNRDKIIIQEGEIH